MPLPPTKDHLEAFNDLALQWVPIERIEAKPSSFWEPMDSAVEDGDAEVGRPEDEKMDEKKKELDRIQQELVAALSGVTLQ